MALLKKDVLYRINIVNHIQFFCYLSIAALSIAAFDII